VQIDRRDRRQTLIGFGGAFTEAAAVNFAMLPAAAQQRVVDLYWGAGGLGYTLGRVPINSCDFSVAPYNFDGVAGDWDLLHFDDSVAHDVFSGLIPMLQRAAAAATEGGRTPLRLFGSPWSPPAWLKAPILDHAAAAAAAGGPQEGSMDGSAAPEGLKRSAAAQATWAAYLSRWAGAYAAHGLPLWGLTVQNEPEFAAPWEACKFNASFEASFVRDFLGPKLRADHPTLKLMAFDHNKDHLEVNRGGHHGCEPWA